MGLIEALARHTGGPTMKSLRTDAIGGAIHEQRLRKQSTGATHLAPYVLSCGCRSQRRRYIVCGAGADKRLWEPRQPNEGCTVRAHTSHEGCHTLQGVRAAGGFGRSEKEACRCSLA